MTPHTFDNRELKLMQGNAKERMYREKQKWLYDDMATRLKPGKTGR
jgi:hypothetical protein